MMFEQVALESVDGADETYRISDELDSGVLRRSLSEAGQLNPALLVEAAGGALRIVTGFRRVRALRGIGRRQVLARIMPPTAAPLTLFRTAVWDNLSHRTLAALEIARVLATLQGTCALPQSELVDGWLPAFGLPAHKNVLRSYLRLNGLAPGLRSALRDGQITVQTAERFAAMTQADQQQAAVLLQRIRLSASLQRQTLDLLEEIAVTDNCTPAGILQRPEILCRCQEPHLSPFQRGEEVYEYLYRVRHPRLTLARERFARERSRLGLPGSVRLYPDPYFETPRVRVEFDATSAEGFREVASALEVAARTPALDALFKTG